MSAGGRRAWVWAGAVLCWGLAGAALWYAWGKARPRGGAVAGVGQVGASGPSARASTSTKEHEQAREALRAGRLDRAFAYWCKLNAGSYQAEDFFQLGTVLLERDRLALGWAALEAAHRIGPDHAATARALDDLQGKLTPAVSRGETAYSDAAEEVEFLGAVRGGPPLGLFVLGLARYATKPARERDFLDRLLVRDRSELAAIATTGDALKRTAALLLEVGRPVEARDLLMPVIGWPRPEADAKNLDRDAAWLLSRAALQLDEDEAADTFLKLAGGAGAAEKNGPRREPSPYVGSRSCAACHGAIYRVGQGADNPHAQTLHRGSGLKDVPLPAGPVPDAVAPGLSHHFSRPADDRIDLESRGEDQTVRAVVRYALGSGRHGITMVARDEARGRDRELRVSYFQDGTWGQTKGIDFLPSGEGEAVGVGLSHKALRQCLHCHTTWFRAADPLPALPVGPETRDRGIGCERCHGPGLHHEKAMATGFAEKAIGRGPKGPPSDLLRSCAECHSSNGSVEPGDPEFTRLQGTTLKFSRCFTATGGALHCARCHDPHRGLDENLSHYDAKCLSCHAGRSPRPSGGDAARKGHDAPTCPINPAADCVSCHMPRVTDPSRRSSFTDHHIRVHPHQYGPQDRPQKPSQERSQAPTRPQAQPRGGGDP